MEFARGKIKAVKILLAGILAIGVLMLGHVPAAYSQDATGITVPPAFKAEILSVSPYGLRYNDVTVAPWGEVVVPLVDRSRVPCDSYIMGISQDGVTSHFADPCIDNVNNAAFGPNTGDILIFSEAGGYWDHVYWMTPYGGAADVRLIADGFIVPHDIAFSPAGDLYVADTYVGKIYKISQVDFSVTTFAQYPKYAGGYPVIHEVATGITFDSEGNLYLSDYSTGNVLKITAYGAKSIYASGFTSPSGLVFTPDGYLLVADLVDGTISYVTPDGTGGTLASGLNHPMSMAFDPDNYVLYIMERENLGTIWPSTRIIKISYNTVTATIDIKPETLNLPSDGLYYRCIIELPEGMAAEDIDASSVVVTRINGVKLEHPLQNTGRYNNTIDRNLDGIPEFRVLFYRQELIPLLTTGDVQLTVSGELINGQLFEGTGTIIVIDGSEQ